MRDYARLLAHRHVVPLIVAQILARSPFAMLPLAMLALALDRLGGFDQAALVVAAVSGGQAVSTILTARLVLVLGIRATLLLSTAVSSAALFATVFADSTLLILTGLAGLAGVTTPPVQAVARAVYPSLVSAGRMPQMAYLDASAQESIWLVGPIAVSALLVIDPAAGVLLTAAVLLAGGTWFALLPPMRLPLEAGPSISLVQVLCLPIVRRVSVLSVVFGASCAALDTAVVAQHGNLAGLLLALWAAISVVGGLCAGLWRLRRARVVVFAAVFAIGAGLWLACAHNTLFAIGLTICGLATAPLVASMFELVRKAVDAKALLSSNAWLITAQLLGYALGSAVAGLAIETGGATGGFTLGALLAIAVVLAAALASARADGGSNSRGMRRAVW